MHLNFKTLQVQGFKSFQARQTISFADLPNGLLFLTGKNSVEPDLGANGAGKSSLWDGLSWALYGKTVRGLKAGNVKNWNSKIQCGAELEFDVGENEYSLVRTWSPIILQLTTNGSEPRTVSQDEIEALIGLDHKSFIQSIVMGQFSDMFFDLPATAKSDLFSSVVSADRWLEFSSKAKDSSDDYSKDLDDIREEHSELLGEIKQLKKADYSDQIESWQSGQDIKLSLATSDAVEYQDALASELDKIPTLKKRVKKSAKKVLDALHAVDDVREYMVVVERKVGKLKKKANSARGEVLGVREAIKKYNDTGNDCPYCEQSITKSYKKEQVAVLNKTLVGLEVVISDLDKRSKKKNNEALGLYAELNEAVDHRSKMQTSNDKLETELSVARDNVQRNKSRVERAVKVAKDLQKEKNPFARLAAKTNKELKTKRHAAKDLKTEIIALTSLIDSINYWKKGFKDVRLLLIKESLLQFEVEVNNCLQSLGLKDWSVTFDVDTETASGTIKKGFAVLISSPHNEKPVPWEVWCGGESQRLRLAGNMGLANLILNRKGITTNLEVWDEPSTWLSSAGIHDLMESLYYRASDLDKQLWIVDHRSLDYGNFAKVVTVEKTKKGSIIIEE